LSRRDIETFYHPLHDNHTATMMPVPRCQIPILIGAGFLSRLPCYNRGRLHHPRAGGWSQRVEAKPRRRSALSFDMMKLARRLESAGSPRSKLAICRKASLEAISSLATKDRLLHEIGRLEVRWAS
jgi:hypothetical protein